jgi:uncharacterized protein (TIGR00251 family)
MPCFEREGDGGLLVRVKAVPGARRDEIVGLLGDRLKVRVSAAPEGGKANGAIAALLAGALGVRARDVQVVSGATSPEKTLRVAGVSEDAARRALLP